MTFLEQFEQLRLKTPRIGLQCVNNTNSPFCQYTERSKNCYMTFASYESEDCMYNHRIFYCTDCNDCALCQKCTLCYESLDCLNCYNCDYCDHCENCNDCNYCYHCIGCKNCFGCVGLHQSQYHIFNKKYEQSEYDQKVAEYKKHPPEKIQSHVEPVLTKIPRNQMYSKKTENSYGENLHNSRDSYWAFDSKGLHDCMYVYHCDDSKDLHDCSHLGWSEIGYEIMNGGNLNDCMFCLGCWYSNNLTYCDTVHNSKDCFLCDAVNHARFRILNQQYSEEDYHKKVAEIIAQMKIDGEWGQWFPSAYTEVITYGL